MLGYTAHQNLSKFLNNKYALAFQAMAWSLLAGLFLETFFFADDDVNVENLVYIFTIQLVFLIVPLSDLRPTRWRPITNLFEKMRHVRTLAGHFLDMIVVYGYTVLKSDLPTDKGGGFWRLILAAVSLYFCISANSELLRIKDRGMINGAASVIILTSMQSLGIFCKFQLRR
ncbi:unnamed protein product [Microthlaspi erraticum]|uniref:Uncharacterized protein n=1 Tax=Microthlaspi erraticum TaxID=1685480 RepID=A0A6D2I345_9BRAS|nr:unnamed protein product [Microthlaspi erraticum]